MAPPPSQGCDDMECQYVTPEGIPTWEILYSALTNHTKTAHPTPVTGQPGTQAQGQAKPRAEKVPRPQIKLGVSQDEFSYFQDEWTSYKRSCDIRDETETRDQLRAACNEDLRRNLFNCLGSKLKTLTEQQMMDEIQQLAVLAQNNLVKIVQLLALYQDREEPISKCISL